MALGQGETGVRFFIPLCGKAGDLMHLYKVFIIAHQWLCYLVFVVQGIDNNFATDFDLAPIRLNYHILNSTGWAHCHRG